MNETPIFVGLAGGSGSGKSFLAKELKRTIAEKHSVRLLTLDRYYHCVTVAAFHPNESGNYDHPDALDKDLILTHINALQSGQSVQVPDYCFLDRKREGGPTIDPARVILVEGLFALYWPSLLQQMDLTVFIDVPEEERLRRRIVRDAEVRGRGEESVRLQWTTTVQPMYEQYIEPTAANADLCVSGEAEVQTTVKQVLERLNLN